MYELGIEGFNILNQQYIVCKVGLLVFVDACDRFYAH